MTRCMDSGYVCARIKKCHIGDSQQCSYLLFTGRTHVEAEIAPISIEVSSSGNAVYFKV
jgi:hypothetical protein